jgi:hypothetical protein
MCPIFNEEARLRGYLGSVAAGVGVGSEAAAFFTPPSLMAAVSLSAFSRTAMAFCRSAAFMSACAGVASLWQAARPKASSRANRPGRDFMAELPCVWHESQARFKGFSPGGRGHSLLRPLPRALQRHPTCPVSSSVCARPTAAHFRLRACPLEILGWGCPLHSCPQ